MRTAQPDKRTRLIETATKLAYGRGFRETSLADIAEAARVPVGNVYYYFKTKEELAEAVVERRLEEFRAARAEWDRLRDRKSTRLNSSHANISYAVFCLKKKKKDRQPITAWCVYAAVRRHV